MVGEKFGHLIVLEKLGKYCLCKCECGAEKFIRMDHLKSGATVSCGCIGMLNSSIAKTTHGMSNTRVFKIWLGMIDRCRNDRTGNYGKRGITVCPRWLDSFDNFYADMGEPPSLLHSIDRKDVNGNYEPGNCRWATRIIQARNTRRNTILEFQGENKTIAEWAEFTGIKPSTICVRLYNLGWSIEKTLTLPAQQRLGNKPWTILGLSRTTYYRKRKEGVM